MDTATHDTRFYKHADLIELDQASYLYTRKIFNFHCPDIYFIFCFCFCFELYFIFRVLELLFFIFIVILFCENVMHSPDECFNLIINNTKRVGKLNSAFLFTIYLRQNNRLLKSKGSEQQTVFVYSSKQID